MNSFNVLDSQLNIHQNYLLEASAGTGKTFSIENIVVRLLIEETPKAIDALTIEKILVVTFTRAATRDLKMRIRTNIEKCLRDLVNPYQSDISTIPDYLHAIIEKGENHVQKARHRLEQALFTFDEAQIFTIHAFCARMLQEYALEGDIHLGMMESDKGLSNSEMLLVIRNFFRSEMRACQYTPEQLSIILRSHSQNIENLENKLLKQLKKGFEIEELNDLTTHLKLFHQAMNHLKSQYSFSKVKILEDFEKQVDLYKKQGDRDEAFSIVEHFAELLEKNEWNSSDLDLLIQDDLYFAKTLDPQHLKAKKKPLSNDQLNYPNLVENLQKILMPLIDEARSDLYIFARMARDCQKMLQRYIHQEEKLRFDDFLRLMSQALENPSFIDKVRNRYQAVVIDEFQDTDPIQWKIFQTLYLNRNSGFLYLVGDPKQSIYAFRQADIYTYLNAAKLIGKENHASLNTNYRSSPDLIHALNQLFLAAPSFIDLPRIDQILKYPAVKASERFEQRKFSDDLGAIHFCLTEIEEKTRSFPIEKLEEEMLFPFIAKEFQRLHELDGFHFGQMAILVRDHFQANRLAKFLKSKGLPISIQRASSLTESNALLSLHELLNGILHPHDESLLKIALGGGLIGWTHEEIRELDNHQRLEKVLASFHEMRILLLKEGFAPFFNTFMQSRWHSHEKSVNECLLSQEMGIEFYQDLMQITDLLIEYQNKTKASADNLLEFLNDFERLDLDEDERLKRKSDPNQNAIPIMTIHSSKGLEYEIVFALGLINRTQAPEFLIPIQHADRCILRPILNEDHADYRSYCEECDAEKMRQLYVAMTRAKHRLYLPVALVPAITSLKFGTASPMDLFLARLGKPYVPRENLYASILNFKKGEFCAFLDHLKVNTSISYSKLCRKMPIDLSSSKQATEIPQLIPPTAFKIPGPTLFMQSFTMLAKRQVKQEMISHLPPPKDYYLFNRTEHTLPAGIQTGIALHSILETIPSFQIHEEVLTTYIRREIQGSQLEKWEPIFSQMIQSTLQAPLHHDTRRFCLADISMNKCFREMEFLYPFEKECFIEELNASPGFLKGVIDLTFEHEGKYYLLDWKSNWLGPSKEYYEQEHLVKAMDEHHYFLQAMIYTKALKKYLHIFDKRPFEDIFGGIFYLFLRGINPHSTTGIYFFKLES